MSSSPFARYGVHASADSRGFSRPSNLREAPLYPRRRIPAVPRTALPRPPTREPLDRITTPPRLIRRPNRRLLIDPPGFRAFPTARPQTRRRLEIRRTPQTLLAPPHPARPSLSTSDPKADFVVINGTRTLKRRAEDTELDLVASANNVDDVKSPIVIIREGQIYPIDNPDQDKKAAASQEALRPPLPSQLAPSTDLDHMRWDISIRTFWTRMISSVCLVVSGLTGRIGRWSAY